jgi:glutathione S-transferase
MWLMEKLSLTYSVKTYKRSPTGMASPELKEVHKMGKLPILSIEMPQTSTSESTATTATSQIKPPLVLAESAVIMEYLLDHFGGWESGLVPARYESEAKDGNDAGRLAQESEAWLRYRYYMHFAEGSFMSIMQVALVFNCQFSPPL